LNNPDVIINQAYLDTLGPYLYILSELIILPEEASEEWIDSGFLLHNAKLERKHELGYFCRSFMVFRGALVPEEALLEWKASVTAPGQENRRTYDVEAGNLDKPGYIRFKGKTNAFESFRAALQYCKSEDRSLKPVLYVVSLRNYRGYPGKRQTSDPELGEEILLNADVPMFVLGCQEYHITNLQRDRVKAVELEFMRAKDEK